MKRLVRRRYQFELYGPAGYQRQTYDRLRDAKRMIKANMVYGYDRFELVRLDEVLIGRAGSAPAHFLK